KTKVSLLLIVVSCTLMLSCQTSKLLHATFESDAVNGLPNKALPGDPAGDEITFDAVIEPQLKVQNSTISGSRSLYFTNVAIGNPPASQRFLRFKGASTDLSKTVWFTYAAQNVDPGMPVYVDVSDGYSAAIARLIIEANGAVSIVKGSDYTQYELLGNVGSQVHTVIFTTSLASKTFNVTIFKESGPAITVENKPFIQQDHTQFHNPARPTITFSHQGTTSSHTYALGFVSISKEKPKNMP
ncbi:MAG TPA: hypothetical protein VK658_10645, partial [Chryseolinea sp.]|nr:hypothetical protein [Chryseolinea sp.]